jgi:hypothetical protein
MCVCVCYMYIFKQQLIPLFVGVLLSDGRVRSWLVSAMITGYYVI